jgi:hypothetical protein
MPESPKTPTNESARERAEKAVDEAGELFRLTPLDRQAIVEAVTEDLGVAADQLAADHDRIVKLEAQTHVLADAVVAIADTGPSVAVAPAIKAVKDEM